MQHSPTVTNWSRKAQMVLVITLTLASGLASRSWAQSTEPSPTQTNEGGGVTIKATWLEPLDQLEFKIVLDTHSVNLDSLDLGLLTSLRGEHLKSVSPVAWNAPSGGHHREGILRFPARDPGGATVYATNRVYWLTIRDVAGVTAHYSNTRPICDPYSGASG